MKLKLYFLFLLYILFSSSCGIFLYKSPTAKVNLFEKRNDFNAQLNMGGAGTELYAAYSPVDYIGFSAGIAGYKRDEDSNSSLHVIPRSFRDFEISVIPYFPYQQFRFEMLIGIGFTKYSFPGNPDYSPYTRTFFQPTIGFHSEYFEPAFFIRCSSIDYFEPRWGKDTRYEPGMMFRGGSKNFKAMLQFRLDSGTNYSQTAAANLPIEQRLLYLSFHVSLGITISLNFGNDNETVK